MQGVTPQNRHVTSLTHDFLNVHWDRKRPLLLGYSGGPDSKALLYALLECGVTPHLAHVDHGWREESSKEVEILREEANALGCPFYSVRLNLEKKEDAARRARLAYFSSLMESYEALLLAHQADDLAETVLKRVLEGAHLAHFGAMQPVSRQNGMTIWRPLLNVRRAQILTFLEERCLTPLIDSSNLDPAYLRARMRSKIFPFLNEHFGKTTTENLTLLSQRAYELKAYLDRRIERIPIHKGPWGILVDLNGVEPIEQRHLLLKLEKTLTRPVLDTILNWIHEGVKEKLLTLKFIKISVDRGRVCLISLNSKDSNSTL